MRLVVAMTLAASLAPRIAHATVWEDARIAIEGARAVAIVEHDVVGERDVEAARDRLASLLELTDSDSVAYLRGLIAVASLDLALAEEHGDHEPIEEREVIVAAAPLEQRTISRRRRGRSVRVEASQPETGAPSPTVQIIGRERVHREREADGYWRVPIDDPRVTSRFGPRIHPVTGEVGRMHRGIDYGAPTGTPVYATADGEVLLGGYCDGATGNCVVIDHGNGWRSQYFHLSRVDVGAGDRVRAGEQIGAVGSTGRSTGPHLHFQLGLGTEAIDPELLLGMPIGWAP